MEDQPSKRLVIEGVDFEHARLVELFLLADQAKPFYEWVEHVFQTVVERSASLAEILVDCTKDEIEASIRRCYSATQQEGLPLLFDGIGRSYPHQQACYYFFAWLARDAPKQRLEPLLNRMARGSRKRNTDNEIAALSALLYKYRENLRTFSWDVIREVIVDRLEGSRRSISGHRREAVVRTAFLRAVQAYYSLHSNYGVYTAVEVIGGQIKIGNETYDVSVSLSKSQGNARRILAPVKTRETEGGGHAHLFTRDIMSAINAARKGSPDDFIVVVIVAQNWAEREAATVKNQVDHASIFNLSPNEFIAFDEEQQEALNQFVAQVLEGSIMPKQGGN